MQIDGRQIGAHTPPFVVAEIGSGHCGSLDMALDLVRDAKRGGAHAVKLQTYTPESMVSRFRKFCVAGGAWDGQDLYALYEKAQTPRVWHAPLFEEARRIGITLFSSPFSPGDVGFLEELGCPAYKIASCEIAHMELLEAVRLTKKPVIVSTGMASFQEVNTAVEALYGRSVALLHCISGYPVPVNEANIWKVRDLKSRFPHREVGYSDHSKGAVAAIAAVALGATIVEKHIGERESMDGGFAENPVFLSGFTARVRDAWLAMQEVEPVSEWPARQLRRSVHAASDIQEGEILTSANLTVLRPSGGLDPAELQDALGKTATALIAAGAPITSSMFR